MGECMETIYSILFPKSAHVCHECVFTYLVKLSFKNLATAPHSQLWEAVKEATLDLPLAPPFISLIPSGLMRWISNPHTGHPPSANKQNLIHKMIYRLILWTWVAERKAVEPTQKTYSLTPIRCRCFSTEELLATLTLPSHIVFLYIYLSSI